VSEPYVHYRGGRLSFSLPPGWRLGTLARGPAVDRPPDPAELTRRALDHPIGAPRPADRVRPSDRAAVIVEDLTRASPKSRILPVVLDELKQAGLDPDRVTVVIALGTHRPLTDSELTDHFGPVIQAGYRVVNHDCHAPDLVEISRLPGGWPVKVHPAVAQADLVIGLGSIFPHPMNGFGGGGKILFPGVADFDAIRRHHMALTFADGSEIGRLSGNPFYETIRDVTTERLDFIVNTVLDTQDRAVDMVAGHPVQAHLAGVEKCRPHITERFDQPADLVITSSFPYNEGPQIVKALAPAAMAAKPGAPIVLAADLIAPPPDFFVAAFESFHQNHGRDLAGAVIDRFRSNRLILDIGVLDLNMALGMTLRLQAQHPMVLMSGDIGAGEARRMGFGHAPDMESVWAAVENRLPRDPLVHVIPSGGVILPEVG
jgi:hypothetical protein